MLFTSGMEAAEIVGLGRTCAWQIAPQISSRNMPKLQQLCQQTVQRAGPRRTVDRECRTGQIVMIAVTATYNGYMCIMQQILRATAMLCAT